MSIPLVPPSPGVGQRRKGPRSLPKLPLSAFTPPSSSTQDSFPLPPSPATAHPSTIVDASVTASPAQLAQWITDAGDTLGSRIGAVVLLLRNTDQVAVDKILKELENPLAAIQVLSVAVPFRLDDPVPVGPPAYLNAKVPTSHSAVYTENMANSIASLRWALQQGRPIDIDLQARLQDGDAVWENFEDLLTKSTKDLSNPAPIVLSNVLPPPQAHTLPLVQLMNHPTYRSFQTQIAALSLFPNLYIKFLPPAWGPTPSAPSATFRARSSHFILSQTPISAVTPSSASPAAGLWAGAGKGEDTDKGDTQQLKDWKRRIKMYLGPVVEAFGYSRIIFGSSPPPSSQSQSKAGDWYQIARDCFLELGVDQEAVDCVFGLNAKNVYGS